MEVKLTCINKDRKTNIVFRVSEEEKNLIAKMAEEKNLNVSNYIRYLINKEMVNR